MKKTILIALGIATAGFSTGAAAYSFEFGEFSGRINSSFTLGTTLRLEDQDPRLIGISNRTADGKQGRAFSTNIDDGNLAFEKGDITSAAAKLSSELNIGRGDFGLFVRGRYTFDAVLFDHDFFDREDYSDGRGRDLDDLDRRRDRLQGRLGNRARLLDAYLYGGFDIADRWVSFRLGRQVINWGESVFVLNGINSILSVDAAQVRVPGVKLEEVFLPAGMLQVSSTLTENISFEAFYQFEWVETEADPAGSFFSSSDAAGFGAESVETAFGRCFEHAVPIAPPIDANRHCAGGPGGTTIPRVGDNQPSDTGQGGIALRSFIDRFGGIDVALYAVNYHSRLPLFSANATPAGFEGVAGAMQYFLEYPEDIRLYGASFNMLLPFGGIAFQGEYSLKQDQPLQIDAVQLIIPALRVPIPAQTGPFEPGEYVRGWRRHDVHQVDFSLTKILGPGFLGQDQSLLLFEIAGMQVDDLPDPGTLAYEAPATDTPNDPLAVALLNGSANGTAAATGLPEPEPIVVNTRPYAEEHSWGYRVAARITYNNVFNKFNVSPTLFFAHDVNGTSPGPIANFVEDRKELRLAVDALYLENFSVLLGYTRHFGAADRNLLQDRDNISLSAEYSF